MKKVVSSCKLYIGYTLVHHVQLQKTRETSVENTGRPKRVGQESKPKCNAMRTKHACPLQRTCDVRKETEDESKVLQKEFEH